MEIKVTNLNKIYNSETILNNISFSLNKGEKIGLVGKNGVGKTTLLKILAGVLNQDGNDVIFKKNIKIGYMPQDTNIQTNELVYDYIYRVSKINPLIEKYKINIILEAFDLNFLINKNYKIQNLSSGEKSKVFLISLLLLKPDILLLDEPTNHLDIKTLI